jgi:hypothetical protein
MQRCRATTALLAVFCVSSSVPLRAQRVHAVAAPRPHATTVVGRELHRGNRIGSASALDTVPQPKQLNVPRATAWGALIGGGAGILTAFILTRSTGAHSDHSEDASFYIALLPLGVSLGAASGAIWGLIHQRD